ncbi:MAG: phage tail tape measure protein, partial [Candidatus Brocadiales bacterium]|nr:phage tail tape measure protein [Candidatus Brocadiales bacterium]
MADLAQLGIVVNVSDQNAAQKLTALSTAADNAANSVDKLEKASKKASSAIGNVGGKRATDSLNTTKTATDKATASWAKLQQELNKVKAAFATIGNTTTGLKNLQSQLNKVNAQMALSHKKGKLATSAYNKMALASDNLSNKIAAQRKLLATHKKELGGFALALDRIIKRVKQFAAFVVAAMIVQVFTKAIRGAISIIIDFDQALKSLQAIAGATAIEAAVMGDVIRKIAADTKFSAIEIAEGMQTIGKAGFTAGKALKMIQGVSNLATGALEDFNKIAGLVVTTIKAFGLEVVQTNEITDVFANAITKSKLSADSLVTAFGYVGAAGEQTGLTLNEVAGTLMVLADNGIRASTMGTALRKTLLSMVAPNTALKDALFAVGLSINDINPGLVGYETALKNLAPLVWDFERATVDMAKAKEFFGIRASQVAAILIRETAQGGGIFSAIESTKELGAALRMAEKQQEGLGVKFKNLGDTIKNVALAVGDSGMTGMLHKLVDALKSTVTWMENFIKKVPIIQFVGNAAIVALAGAFLLLATRIGTAATALKTFSLLLISTPAGRMALGITAIAVAMTALRDKTDENIETLKRQNVALQQNISTMDSWITVLDTAAKKGEAFYNTALVRFVAENKELSEKIIDVVNAHDLLNGKTVSSIEQVALLSDGWEKYSKIIKEALNISRFEAAEAALNNFTTTFVADLKEVNEKFKDATTFNVDNAGNNWKNAENALKNTVKRMVTDSKEVEVSLESFRSQINETATLLSDAAKTKDDPFEYAKKAIVEFEKTIQGLLLAPEIIQEIMDAVKAKLTLGGEAGINELKKLFVQLPEEINEQLDKLSTLELFKFDMASMSKQAGEYRNFLVETLGRSAEDATKEAQIFFTALVEAALVANT